MSQSEPLDRDPPKIKLVREGKFGFGSYDSSRQSRPANITEKLGSADLISLEGAVGMVMPVGHKGINGRATGPFYDLSTLAPWLSSKATMPHSREPAGQGLRKLYPIRWTNVGMNGVHPHPNYDLQNTVEFLHILQDQYPLLDVEVSPVIENEVRVGALNPPELNIFLDEHYDFRRCMSEFTLIRFDEQRVDWLIPYWKNHIWYADVRGPAPPHLRIPPVVNLQYYYDSRAHFRFRMAKKLNVINLSPQQCVFHEYIRKYWIAHPFDFRNDDVITATAYFRNITSCIGDFPEAFRNWHHATFVEYYTTGRHLR